jgi:hypothetical protein
VVLLANPVLAAMETMAVATVRTVQQEPLD